MSNSPPQPWHSLHYHRVKAGLSLQQLADRAGLARSYVGFLENGTKPRTATATVRLAAALGIDPAELRADLTPTTVDPEVFSRIEGHLATLAEQLAALRELHATRGAA